MLAQNQAEIAANLRRIIAACAEWLLAGEHNFALQTKDEIEVATRGDKLVFSCLTARGWQSWTVIKWDFDGGKLTLETVRKLSSAATQIELVPRESIEVLRDETNAARLVKARELAEIARRTLSNAAQIERVTLNQSNVRKRRGTMARILLKLPNGKTVAATGSIVEQTALEILLSGALLWLTKLQEGKRKIAELWLIVPAKAVDDVGKLVALLRESWRDKLRIARRDDENSCLVISDSPTLPDLWRETPKKLLRPAQFQLSETACKIIEFAPEAIDVVRSRHGETLRFHGLPFARVREILGETRAWFGLTKRRILDESTWTEFHELLENLRENRRADAADKQHKLYRAAPESWLETILRGDISRLDPNLILAPLFAQFRLNNKQGALDLLALRTDGRLVVIELKANADREHIFQAANYWRQIEQQRRAGHIAKAKLFNDLPILDAPPLVYLVAPLMSFHRDFDLLAQSISTEIELWRFDLNEDWRAEIRVARRKQIGG